MSNLFSSSARALKQLALRMRAWVFSAGLIRAIAETLLFNLILGAGLLLLDVSPFVKQQALFFFIQPLGGAWYALRLRPVRGPWWQQVLGEGVFVVIVSAVLVIVPLIYGHALGQAEPGGDALSGLVLVLVIDFARSIIAITILRGGARLWAIWDRLRRTRMVWALTHAQLTIVVILALLFVVVILAYMLQSNVGVQIALEQPSPTASLLARIFVSVLPVLGLLIVVSVMALLAVLPPAMLFSYWFARRTTRRLERLTQATSTLRAGDYTARVKVEGEDEVARLQADFNAMAGEMECTLTDLKLERDKVAGLLHLRRQLVAAVSHELRTPVATLRGYLESTLSHQQDLPYTLGHDLAVMEQETLRLQSLIDDLFTLARAEAGGLTLQLKPVNMAVVVRCCVDVVAPLAWRSSKVEVLVELPASLPPAMADEGRLEQIIHNLLRNAIRHTPPGGIVAVSATATVDAIALQVRDTGEGISPADLPHIWERFYRAESTRAHDAGGAGLGLALVKELAEAMDGTVAVHSDPGQGSSFTVRLPLACV
jgi:signal transduction histidine kinase